MKSIGIIGGIAPASTIEYYRQIVAGHRERTNDGSYPSVVINSIDMTRMLRLIGDGALDEVATYLADEVQRLARAGVEIALLASNTPHMVFDEIQARSPLPLVSIVEATAEAVAKRALRRVCLLGTRFTMEGSFYPGVFAQHGIKIVTPSPEERRFLHDAYMGELVHGRFLDQTRAAVLNIVERLQRDEGAEGTVLGGTELPLLLPDGAITSMPVFDTTRIHVAAILDLAL